MIGTKLAHYEITSHLGTGGMGEVYQATDTKLGRSVAIKLLPEAFSRDSDRAARFEREARLLASLNHSHIAAIYGIEEINQRKFLVMELATGETLAEYIRRGPVPLDEVRPIAKQIAEALEAAHEKGILHRDLKPANIKITPQGDVKVLDFGLAKAFAGDSAELNLSNSPTLSMAATNAGVILGTAAYMSPEQAKGKQADRTSDIWAFGCVLFEMLAGRPAFEGETLGEILGSIFKSEPDWNRLPSGTPAGIRRLLRRCLQKDRKLRLHDIADARIEIDEAFDDAPAVSVRPDRVSRWRERIVWIAMLALFAAAAWMLKPESKSSSTSIARLTIALPPGDQLVITADTSITLSEDGSKLAYVATRAGIRQVYVRAIDDRNAKPIPGTEGAAGIVFSPDVQWIGFFQQGKLKKIPVSGGASQILGTDITFARGLDWGADDNIYYVPGTTSGIWRVPARGGTPEQITKLDRSKGEISHRLPQLLPGGKALVFTIWTGPEQDAQSVHIQNLVSGEHHVLIMGADSGRYVPSGHLVAHRAGALSALPFDLSNFTVSNDPPTPLVESIGGSEGGVYTVSKAGLLAYPIGSSSARDGRLDWVDRAGKIQELSVTRNAINSLTLSPDGHRAAVESAPQVISIYDFARATSTPFVLNTVGASQGPLWSTDGQHIVYRATRSGFRNLYWKAVDGASEEERLTTSENVQTPGSFSPDGKWLVFRENDPKTAGDIWVLNLQDRKPQVFLNTNASEGGAAFSRDGHWIAYFSDDSGTSQVYARPFPGPGPRVQISTEGGSDPVWSRNGHEIFFLNGDKMMAADISSQATLTVGPPHMLFQGRFSRSPTVVSSFDVDKDGRFLMAPDSKSEQSLTQINVVLNWFEELRKLAPVR